MAKLTLEQKRKQFWKHNINPITGYFEQYTSKVSGSGIVESQSTTLISVNGFNAKHN